MSNIKRYNIFILLSTLARNIVEVFSSVLLYKMGYSLKEILLFYSLVYLTGAITSTIVIYLTKILKPKYILIAVLIFAVIVTASIGTSVLFGGSINQFSFTEDFSFSIGGTSAFLTILLASYNGSVVKTKI